MNQDSPENSPETPAHAFNDTRELKRPYYMLRLRGGEKPFYSPEIQGIIRDPKSPLTPFLPAAGLDNPQKPGLVTFELPPEVDRSTLTRMDRLPGSTIRSFQSAAESFIAAEGLDPFRRQTREAFLLPDPEEEPDAWWVFGPPQDRRLLVLWGCEFQRGTSLPLLPDPRKPGHASILDRLQARKMEWADYQSQMRDLLIAGKEPLSRFVARPEKTRKGEWKSLLHRGRRLDWAKTKPFKTAGKGEINAFTQAAANFLQQAHPESESISEYEKELRANFRLPDLEKQPELFRIAGGKLVIAVPDDLAREDTLCPVEDEELGLPAPEAGEGGAEIIPDTVAGQLQSRATPWMARGIAAGVVLVLLVAAGVLFEAFADRTPPRVTGITSDNTPHLVQLEFNKDVNPEHLEFAERVTPEEAARGRADVPVFQISDEAGRRVRIRQVRPLDERDRVELRTENPMPEGNYTLTVVGVQDVTRKRNRIDEPVEYSFQVRDTLPPELEQVSADLRDPRAVLLIFNEPLERASATNRANFEIRGRSILRAEHQEDPRVVRLLANEAFEEDQPYTLVVDNVRDDSLAKNPIPGAITFPFVYRDTIPPEIAAVEASTSQLEVVVRFSERVTSETAQVPANYTITAEGRTGPAVHSAQLYDDAVTLVLMTDPLYNGVEYALSAQGVKDQGGGNLIAMKEPVPFRFTGREDRDPPAISLVETGRRSFRVTFNKPLVIEPLLEAANWSFTGTDIRLAADPRPVDDRGRQIFITPAQPLDDRLYTLTFTGEARDRIGNVADGLTSPEFRGVPASIAVTNTLVVRNAQPIGDRRQLVIVFNEPVVEETLRNAANYSLTGNIRVQEATPDPVDPARVTLSLSAALDTASAYDISIRNLRTRNLPDHPISLLTHRLPPSP